jgi:hypothetical protein
MLPSFSPYSSQGLMPQSFVGSPQGGYGMNVPFAHDYPAQSPYAFGAATNPYLQNPFTAYQSLHNAAHAEPAVLLWPAAARVRSA